MMIALLSYGKEHQDHYREWYCHTARVDEDEGEQPWQHHRKLLPKLMRFSRIASGKRKRNSRGRSNRSGTNGMSLISTKGQALKTYLKDLKLAYKMLHNPNFQLERNKKITMIIALLYIVSPIDLIPDAIPFVGLLDDVLVAGYALKQIADELARYKKTLPTP